MKNNYKMKYKIGRIVYYSAMPSLFGEIIDIHNNIYVVCWKPKNSNQYISYHYEDDLL